MEIRKTITDVLFGGGMRVAIRLRGLIFIPLITSYLGVGAFGAYAQLLAILGLLSLVFGLGLFKSLVRYGRTQSRTTDLYSSLFVASLVPSAVVAAGIFVLARPLSEFTLQTAKYSPAYRVGSALVVTRTLFRLGRNYFRVDSRIKLYSALKGVRAYAMITAVAVSVVVLGTGLQGLFAGMVLVDLLLVVGLHVRILQEIGVAVPTFTNLRQHLRYSLPLTWSSLASQINTRADRVLIGVFLGDVAVGLYAVTAQVATGISIYVMPISQAFFPEFSKLIDEGKREQCATFLRSGIRYFSIIAVPSVGGLALVGPDLISRLTAAQVVPRPALIAVVSIGALVVGVESIYGSMMDAAEETGKRATYRTLGAVLNVLLNIVAIPLFGVIGAASATAVATLIVTWLTVRQVNRIIPTGVPWWTLLRCTGATGLMVAADAFFPDSIAGTILVAVPFYFTLLFLSRELSVSELRQAWAT